MGRDKERFATREELSGYLVTDGHTELFLEKVKGLAGIEIGQDNKGAFVLFHIKEDLQDPREIFLADLVQNIAWLSGDLTVRARVKFNFQ